MCAVLRASITVGHHTVPADCAMRRVPPAFRRWRKTTARFTARNGQTIGGGGEGFCQPTHHAGAGGEDIGPQDGRLFPTTRRKSEPRQSLSARWRESPKPNRRSGIGCPALARKADETAKRPRSFWGRARVRLRSRHRSMEWMGCFDSCGDRDGIQGFFCFSEVNRELVKSARSWPPSPPVLRGRRAGDEGAECVELGNHLAHRCRNMSSIH